MALEKKNFRGGLNSDHEDRMMADGDYRYALNIRGSKSDGANEGAIENTKGNTLVNVPLPAGDNKVIGALDNLTEDTVIYFVYNSFSNHSIYEYSVVNQSVTLLLQTSLLNFQRDKYIIDPLSIDDVLFFNDRFNEPRSINVTRARNNDYPIPFEENFLNVIVNAPGFPPLADFKDDPAVTVNNVRNKLFQFRYKWVYLDNEESAWSPISKVAMPVDEAEFRPFAYYPLDKNNVIELEIDLSNEYVKRVKIAAREGNTGDFFLAEDLDKSKLVLNQGLPETYVYKFYNDETYTPIDNDGNSGMRLFDNVPQLADSMSQIDGNKVAFGGITEGYDPVDIDINIEQIKQTTIQTTPQPVLYPLTAAQHYNESGINAENFRFVPEEDNLVRIINGYHYRFIAGQKQGSRTGVGLTGSTPLIDQNQATWTYVPSASVSGSLTPIGNGIIGAGFWSSFSPSTVRDRAFYCQNKTTGAVIRAGGSIVQEVLIKNPTTVGTRYVLVLSMSFIDLGYEDIQRDKVNKVQYVSEVGNNANDVVDGLIAALVNLGVYEYHKVQIQYANSIRISSGSTSLDTSVVVPVGSALLRIFGQAIVPESSKDINPAITWPLAMGQDTGAAYRLYTRLDTYDDATLKNNRTLKSGSTHGLGMVYYDSPNRSGLTNRDSVLTEKTFYVDFPTERGLTVGQGYGETTLKVTINHTPPAWAKRYQFVYTGNQTIDYIPGSSGYKGFVQFKLKDVGNSVTPGARIATINNLLDFNNQIPEAVDLFYNYTKGDRIRFITNPISNSLSTLSYLQEYKDVEVISYDDATKIITFKDPGITVENDQLVEVYTPKRKNDEWLYYEVGECFKVEDGLHLGSTDQTLTTPAIVNLDDIGDVYLRYRVDPMSVTVEDYAFSDFYSSDAWNKGRPNKVDNGIKKVKRKSTIRFSNNYIPSTNINGLSQFDDLAFNEYDQQYGSIERMYGENKDLILFQNLKVGKVRISQTTLYGNDGSAISTLKAQDKVLSDIVYYGGEYGIGSNPESFAVYGNRIYFADIKRGVVLRLGGDGLTPISEYGMHNYFNDTFESIIKANGDIKLFGEYDVRFGEYVLSIQGDISTDKRSQPIKETIAFSEIKKKWTTFYSYIPEFMVANNVGLISFNEGDLYTHNTNAVHNNFYGKQFTMQLRFISNTESSLIKVYNSILTESTHKFSMPKATNQFGQETSLIEDDFTDDEGVFKAHLLKDINTPNVDIPLIEGNDIRCHSMDITLENTDTEEVKIFSAGINLTKSELTGK
jgi:hypothetical protein